MSGHDDYKFVTWGGQVVYDSAKAREAQQQERERRDGEPFTATCDCPKCGAWGVHWLTEPRLKPFGDDPYSRAYRRMEHLMGGERCFDPPGTVISRVCVECEYRWGQT